MRYFSLFLVFIFLSSCTQQRQHELDLIHAEEAKLFNDLATPVNLTVADKLINLYSDFVNDFPNDSLAPVYLFKKAEVLMNSQRPKQAISALDSLIDNYPDSKLVPQAIHISGFIWDDRLKSPEMAKLCFEKLIKKFPNHQLSQNAKDYIKILGKTPEQVIQEFEAANQ